MDGRREWNVEHRTQRSFVRRCQQVWKREAMLTLAPKPNDARPAGKSGGGKAQRALAEVIYHPASQRRRKQRKAVLMQPRERVHGGGGGPLPV